jgi:tRNA(Ile)-lysidine synthase
MLEKVRKTISRYKLIEPQDCILVAVSGGPDSIALLYVLLNMGFSLRIAHLNHCLREEAESDAKFVKEIANKLNLPITIGREDVKKFAIKKRFSIEHAARIMRYSFLESVRKRFNMDKIAIGHTADDQLETLIQRIARGTGLKGLTLIPPARGKIIRPLIEIERGEILEFLKRRNIPYITDRSNYDVTYTRNLVRYKIIPNIRSSFPDFVQRVVRMRRVLEGDEFVIEGMINKIFDNLSKRGKNFQIILDLSKFLCYNNSIRKRIVRKGIEIVKGDLNGISASHIDYILVFISFSKSGQSIDIPGIRIRREYGNVFIERRLSKSEERVEVDLPVPGERDIDSFHFTTQVVGERNLTIKASKKRVFFDLSKIQPPLTIRTRREGDRFQPFGFPYEKKLKDILINDKIPREERQRILLVVDKKGILWICGHRRAEGGRINDSTKRVLVIEVTRTKHDEDINI